MHAFQSILLITANPSDEVQKQFNIDIAHPDVDTLVLIPETSIGIENIRDLKSFTSRRPLKNPTKQIIVLESQLLTIQAQNALLKILEEPPDYLRLILTAPHTHTFLDTILSRCQIIRSLSTKSADSSEVESDALVKICSLIPAERLKLIPPNTKSKLAASDYCQKLITEAKLILQQHPSLLHTENLQIIADCADQLAANANPTLALSDAVLRLRKIS